MRIAVASYGLRVSPSFKQSDNFTCYTVDHGIIAEVQCIPNVAHTPIEYLNIFTQLEISTLITGKINIDTAQMFCDNGIEVIAGTTGSCQSVVEQYLTKELIAGDDSCGTADPE